MGDEYTELVEVEIETQTDKAVLIYWDEEQHWIPWSCIEENGEDFTNGYTGSMFVKTWFYERELR